MVLLAILVRLLVLPPMQALTVCSFVVPLAKVIRKNLMFPTLRKLILCQMVHLINGLIWVPLRITNLVRCSNNGLSLMANITMSPLIRLHFIFFVFGPAVFFAGSFFLAKYVYFKLKKYIKH